MPKMFQKIVELHDFDTEEMKVTNDNLWNVQRKHYFRLKHLKKRTNKLV
jgi:hypothetical protein